MILLTVLVIAVVILAGIVGYYFWKKRLQALARLAASLGLEFSRYDLFALPERLAFLGLFDAGHSRVASNILYGSREGAKVYLFDYRYVTGSGKNRQVHRFNCCVVETGMDFPRLWIRRERWYDKVAAVVGFDDIDFESAEFSRKFFVKSSSKKFAYEVIHPQMMEFLLQAPDKPYIEIHHHICLFYFPFRWNVDVYRYLYEFAFSFLSRIPDWVLQKYARR